MGDLVDLLAPLQDERRLEPLEVGEDEEVGLVAGRDRSQLVEPVPERRVVGPQDERVLGGDAERDRLAHHAVDVPVLGDVLGIAVVGAEGDAIRAELVHEREEGEQVARHRGLADEQPHPRAQPLAPLLERESLVVGADARRRVRVQLLARHPGRVAVHVLALLEEQLGELRLVPGDDAGEVHHLGDAEHPAAAQEALEVARGERAPRRLEGRGRDARRGHEVEVEREVLAARRGASGRRRCRARSRARAGRRRRLSCRGAGRAGRTRRAAASSTPGACARRRAQGRPSSPDTSSTSRPS